APRSSSKRRRRTPQLISNPIPPGEIAPSGKRVAATPPTGNPYPSCMSGIPRAASTIPGSVVTLTSCSRLRSRAIRANCSGSAKTRAGTRISDRWLRASSCTKGPTCKKSRRSSAERPLCCSDVEGNGAGETMRVLDDLEIVQGGGLDGCSQIGAVDAAYPSGQRVVGQLFESKIDEDAFL